MERAGILGGKASGTMEKAQELSPQEMAFGRAFLVKGELIKAYKEVFRVRDNIRALAEGTVLVGQGRMQRFLAEQGGWTARGGGDLFAQVTEADGLTPEELIAKGRELALRQAYKALTEAKGGANVQALAKFGDIVRDYEAHQDEGDLGEELLDFARGVNAEFGLPLAGAIAEAEAPGKKK